MRNREREVVLGAVVFAALVIAVMGTLWLSERYAGAAGGYKLRVHFASVPGLQRGNAVTIRGVKVGKVLGIDLVKGRPVVVIGFDEIRDLPRDSRILLKSEGLLGEKMIEVHVGSDSAHPLEDGQDVRGVSGDNIQILTDKAAEMSERLNQAVDRLVSEGNVSTIARILIHLDSTTANLSRMVRENRGTLSRTLDTLSVVSTDARGVLVDNRTDIRQTVENLRISTDRLAVVSKRMEDASGSLNQVMGDLGNVSGKLRDGKGTLGRLIQDDGMYKSLERTLASVDSLVVLMQRNPEKYLHFTFKLF